jgi:hypothetical protein
MVDKGHREGGGASLTLGLRIFCGAPEQDDALDVATDGEGGNRAR